MCGKTDASAKLDKHKEEISDSSRNDKKEKYQKDEGLELDSWFPKNGFLWRTAQNMNVFGRHILDQDANKIFLFAKIDVLFYYIVILSSVVLAGAIIYYELYVSSQVEFVIDEDPDMEFYSDSLNYCF